MYTPYTLSAPHGTAKQFIYNYIYKITKVRRKLGTYKLLNLFKIPRGEHKHARQGGGAKTLTPNNQTVNVSLLTNTLY